VLVLGVIYLPVEKFPAGCDGDPEQLGQTVTGRAAQTGMRCVSPVVVAGHGACRSNRSEGVARVELPAPPVSFVPGFGFADHRPCLADEFHVESEEHVERG